MIVIVNDSIRGVVSNEEILWSRLEKNLPNCIGVSLGQLEIPLEDKLASLKPDLVIQNANLGKISNYKTISFLQDPLLEMRKYFEPLSVRLKAKIRGRQTFSDRIKKQLESFHGSIKVTNSNFMANMYKKMGSFEVIHLGVDHDLFKPLNKDELKKKYHIPDDRTVKIFVGSQNLIKGFEKIKKMIQGDTRIYWILVLKDSKLESGHNYTTFYQVSQNNLAELYNCADQLVSKSLLESFGLAMVEAMFCNIPVDAPKTGIFWDWSPSFNNPRKEALDYGLDKNTWINKWKKFVSKCTQNCQ